MILRGRGWAPLTQGGIVGVTRLMDADRISIVQKTYDFAVMLYADAAVNRFPRAQKGLLGRELLSLALRLLAQLVAANRRRDKVPELEAASGTLDALRVTLWLAHRLAFLSHGGYEGLSRESSEIGRMLGGWLKQSAAASADTKQERPVLANAPTIRSRAAVRYRMTSPQVERYLKAKLDSPQTIVFVKSGVFVQTFFEDALECGKRLGLVVRNLAADDEPERIPVCGLPVAAMEKYRARLAADGRPVRVEA